jgi:hypothetical protein
MPTAAEFASPSGITAESQDYIKTANGWGDVTDSFSGNAAGTWASADGRRKKYDHASQTVLTYQPFFPAAGVRYTDGALTFVGYEGDYWSSTSYNGSYAYGLYLIYGDVTALRLNVFRSYAFFVRCVKEL